MILDVNFKDGDVKETCFQVLACILGVKYLVRSIE